MHLHRIFDRCSFSTNNRCTETAADRNYIEVDARRPAPIELELELAVVLAFFQRGVIEESELDRFLDLVGEVSGQQDPRDMGIENPNILDGMIVSAPLAKAIRSVPFRVRRIRGQRRQGPYT